MRGWQRVRGRRAMAYGVMQGLKCIRYPDLAFALKTGCRETDRQKWTLGLDFMGLVDSSRRTPLSLDMGVHQGHVARHNMRSLKGSKTLISRC